MPLHAPDYEVDFWVRTRSGIPVGYGNRCLDQSITVYKLCANEDEFEGAVVGAIVEFSSGIVAGSVWEDRVYDSDGDLLGSFLEGTFFSPEGEVLGTAEGAGTTAELAGAIMLLIVNHWYSKDGTIDPHFQ